MCNEKYGPDAVWMIYRRKGRVVAERCHEGLMLSVIQAEGGGGLDQV